MRHPFRATAHAWRKRREHGGGRAAPPPDELSQSTYRAKPPRPARICGFWRRGKLLITLRFAGAWAPIIALASLLAAHQAQAAPATAYVVLGENGARIARAVTSAAECPSLVVDGRGLAMTLRAPAGTEPQRPTRSNPSQSKPSMFDASVCEAALPPTAHTASIGGQALPLPPAVIRRIVVIGDTGCRIKLADKAFQACNDPKAYPFAQVAAAAAKWKPDLVIHVGDYLYRENPCPDGMAGCAGSVWGYGLDAWRADFLEPAAPLLRAAPGRGSGQSRVLRPGGPGLVAASRRPAAGRRTRL